MADFVADLLEGCSAQAERMERNELAVRLLADGDLRIRDLSRHYIESKGFFCVMPIMLRGDFGLCGEDPLPSTTAWRYEEGEAVMTAEGSHAPMPLCRLHFERVQRWANDMVQERREAAAGRRAAERRLEEARPEKESFIYFAMKAGKMKIGTSTDLRNRLRIQQVEPVLILRGNRVGEREMHLRFVHLRCPKPGERSLSNEWFHYEPELQEFVERTRQTQIERQGTTLLDQVQAAQLPTRALAAGGRH